MRIVKRFFLALACLLALCAPALAAGQTGSITLHFDTRNGPVAGASFRAYLVAEADETGALVLSAQYAAYPVDVGDDTQALAQTLAAYTRRDRLPCAAMGTTDGSGVLTLTELPAGLYLILGDRITTEDTAVVPADCLISVPVRRGDEWSFDVDADVKSEVKPPEGPETVARRVLKIWDDAGHENVRPADVTVQLLRDGKIYETVTLNEKNNWRHVWDELDAEYRWEAVEKECPGYTVRSEQNGVTFTLTNSIIPPDTPSKPSMPAKPSARLPQTGQLWWPVPLLAIAGAVLLRLGVSLRRKRHEA